MKHTCLPAMLYLVLAGTAPQAAGEMPRLTPSSKQTPPAAAQAIGEQKTRPATVKTAGVHPAVVRGMEIVVEGSRVTVKPGECRVGKRAVRTKTPTTFEIEPAGYQQVKDEKYVLSSDAPATWARGTHLKGCNSKSTVLPDCLRPGSVKVILPDGTPAARDADYLIDERWACLGSKQGGRLSTDTQVLISYGIGLMRLDSIVVTQEGSIRLVRGRAKKNSPLPAATMTCGADSETSVVLANIFMPYHATTVVPWQVFVIGKPLAEPGRMETKRRVGMVANTLGKLQRGESVTVVTWGDSVTEGCDASSPAKAYPQLFATRLRERFPKSEIKLVNAGIGGSSTNDRLPNLDRDVLQHKPDLVVMEFVNDMHLPPETVRANWRKAIDRIRGAGAEPVILTPHFVMPEWMGHQVSRGKDTRPGVTVLREAAREKACALADTSKRWEHLEQDGIPYLTLLDSGINHPDDRGHELFVRDLMTFFPK